MKKLYTKRTGKLGSEIFVYDFKSGGYTGFFKDFSNIISQGETIKETQTNLWNTLYDVLKYFTEKK
jgi:hypothetical protein